MKLFSEAEGAADWEWRGLRGVAHPGSMLLGNIILNIEYYIELNYENYFY